MKKITVCVLFGGCGAEHEVSLRSAAAVLSHIDRGEYDVVSVGITKKGRWLLYRGKTEKIPDGSWEMEQNVPVCLDLAGGGLVTLEGEKKYIGVDLCFPVLHGDYGEDGRLQGLLDIAGIRYVGCDAFASHLCMDKWLTKMIAEKTGVPVAKGMTVSRSCLDGAKHKLFGRADVEQGIGEVEKGVRSGEFCYPVFVKPCMGGSSAGVKKAKNERELICGLEGALDLCPVALVEEYIDGFEVEVGVMEACGTLDVSSVGMIRYKGEFYDYDTKYGQADNEYIIPAPIGREQTEKIRDYAKRLFVALGCRGLGRFDFFVKKDGGVIFNEVNTMPGFTSISMFPKLFMHGGMSFDKIIDRLIQGAME